MNSALPVSFGHGHPFWSIRHPAGWAMDMLSSAVDFESGERDSRQGIVECVIEPGRIRFQFPDCLMEIIQTGSMEAGAVFECNVMNTSTAELRIRSISPVRYHGDWNAEGIFNVGSDSCIDEYPAERCYGFHGPRMVRENRPVTSCWFLSTNNRGNDGTFLTGIASPPMGFFRYRCIPMQGAADGRRILRWSCEVETLSGSLGVLLTPGSTFRTGAFYLGYAPGRATVFDELSAALAAHSRPARGVTLHKGWCSWYAGYGAAITEAACLWNLEELSRMGGFEVFQIDDGWAEPSPRTAAPDEFVPGKLPDSLPLHDAAAFPHGMKWMADRIEEHGLRAGLWLRPFRRSQRGDLAATPNAQACLDLSSRASHAWLRAMISVVVKEWGFTYLKLDFMTYDFYGCWGMELSEPRPATCAPSDDSLTNIQIYRRGLEVVREAAGDEAIINACNCLVGPAVGIADILRIGDDIDAANWDRTFTMGARAVLPMAFLNGTVFLNDPDCVFLHGPLSVEERRAWLLFVTISGGLKMLSSILPATAEDRHLWDRHLASPVGHFLPYDHWINPPSIWACIPEEEGGAITAALFNWSDTDRELEYPLPASDDGDTPYHVMEWYDGRYLGTFRGTCPVRVPRHAARVLFLRKETGQPVLLALDDEILCEPGFRSTHAWDSGTLHITRPIGRPDRAFIFVPDGFAPLPGSGASRRDGPLIAVPIPEGILHIDIPFQFPGDHGAS